MTEAAAAEEALALAERVAPGLILVNATLAKERDFWLLRSSASGLVPMRASSCWLAA